MCQQQKQQSQQQLQSKNILHTQTHTADDLANTSRIFMHGLEIEIPPADFNCSCAKAYISWQYSIYAAQRSRLIEPHQIESFKMLISKLYSNHPSKRQFASQLPAKWN